MNRYLSAVTASIVFFAFLFTGNAVPLDTHDFTDGTGHDEWYDGSMFFRCDVCHPKRNAELPEVTPLLDPGRSGGEFPVFASDGLDIFFGQPHRVTKMCISCHDGSIGEEIRFEQTDDDLLHGHPVGIFYDRRVTEKSGGELQHPRRIHLPLFSGRLECPTCHDTHRDELRSQALCNECHLKK
jgi:hypothetical protein